MAGEKAVLAEKEAALLELWCMAGTQPFTASEALKSAKDDPALADALRMLGYTGTALSLHQALAKRVGMTDGWCTLETWGDGFRLREVMRPRDGAIRWS